MMLCCAAGIPVAGSATSAAATGSAPVLDAIHHVSRMAQSEQAAKGLSVDRYLWIPDRHTTTRAGRRVILGVWWHRLYLARTTKTPSTSDASGVPAWFVARMPCLARAEEYGPPGDAKGGYDTVAGFFGMSSGPPSVYPGGSVASSWLSLSYWQQIPIVYATWLRVGDGGWPNTMPGCGL